MGADDHLGDGQFQAGVFHARFANLNPRHEYSERLPGAAPGDCTYS